MALYKRKEPLAWGIILIAIGLIFFLSNMDLNVWDFIARLWPLVLVAWGAWKLYFGIREAQEKTETE
jgi:hypothetical protein